MQMHGCFRSVRGLRVLGVAVSLWLLPCAISQAWATSYELSLLKTWGATGSGGRDEALYGLGVLNEKGELVVGAQSRTENEVLEIVTPSKVFKLPGLKYFRPPIASNDRGEMVFLANSSLMALDASGTVRPILSEGDVIDGKKLLSFSLSSLNNKGQVLFSAKFVEGERGQGEGLFTMDRLVAKVGSTIENQHIYMLDQFYLCESGEVLFSAGVTNDSGKSGSTVIFKENQVLVNVGDTIAGKTLDVIHSLVANKNGDVAFVGIYDNKTRGGIFTLDSLVAQAGDTVDGKTLGNLSHLVLNAKGDVAFLADFSDSTGGIILARRTTGQGQAQPGTSTKPSSSFRIGPVLILLGIMCALWLFWPRAGKRSRNH